MPDSYELLSEISIADAPPRPAGAIVDDIPAQSIGWLTDLGHIRPEASPPWSGYDAQTVDVIVGELEDATAAKVTQVKDYESKHKNRTTTIDWEG